MANKLRKVFLDASRNRRDDGNRRSGVPPTAKRRQCRSRFMKRLVTLVAGGWLVSCFAVPVSAFSQALFLRNDAPESIVFETHGDGTVDRAILVDDGEALDLNIFVGDHKIHDPSRKPTLIRKASTVVHPSLREQDEGRSSCPTAAADAAIASRRFSRSCIAGHIFWWRV